MDVEIKKEIFKEIGKDFNSFLQNEENDRIIFSGKYGSGKTTFLKLFFDDPTSFGVRESKYIHFRISPVNYSISNNEDIIEMIKYDLIIEFLLNSDIKVETNDIPLLKFISGKDIKTIFKSLLSIINFKGIKIDNLLKGLEKLKNDLESRKSESDEGDSFINFLDQIENKSGVFERDLITKTIENVFKRINEKGEKTVLIIDDLDRIDPEHIFRILNVFSAHFDDGIFGKRGLKNKFGFDKIIVVCDYNNIQSLFHCKYGKEADFSGYIDKFYTRSIFQFNIKTEIEHYFRQLLYNMESNVVRNYSSMFNGFGREELFERTIIYSILYGLITIRTLNKLIQTDVSSIYKMDRLNFIRNVSDQDLYTVFILKLNLFLFGGIRNFIKALETLSTYNVRIEIDINLVEWIYKIEAYKKHFEDDVVGIKTSRDSFVFDFRDGNSDKIACKIYLEDNKDYILNNSHSLDILKHTLNRVKQLTGIN